jgi:cardiolipin synthase
MNWPTPFHWPLTALEHGAFVLGGLLIYLTSTRLSKQHRHPSAAVAWVMLIALLPYVGVPLYFLFGVRKVPRALPDRALSLPLPEGTKAHWALTLLDGLAMPEPTRNGAVHFGSAGPEALNELLMLIRQARHRVDICTFILGRDAVGQALQAALLDAARRGVKVRLLLDAVGSWRWQWRAVRALRAGGVAVEMFMPVLANVRRGRANLRNHRKLLVVDDERVWSGGRNLAAEYFADQAQPDAWCDISFVVTGPLALQARRLFDQDWQAASGEHPYADARLPPVPALADAQAGSLAQWVPSGPDHADDTVYALLLAAAYRAERRIVLVSPYFVPDDALVSAWCMACRRGVRLTLLIPRQSNHRLADIARRHALAALIEAGGEVRLYPRMVHAKAVIIDDDLALCGSVNLDARSLFLNYELVTAFYGAAEVKSLQQWAQGLVDASEPAQLRPASWLRESFEGLVRLVGFQL